MSAKQKEPKNISIMDRVIKAVIDVIVVIAIALFFVMFAGEKTSIVGNSMAPTLHNGEVILINRIVYKLTDPKRFDIVVFKPIKSEDDQYYIKRVIGLPGETVKIENGKIYVNGQQLNYNEDSDPIVNAGLAAQEIELGSSEYFLIGDNWNNSVDSRFETVGNVYKDDIVGQAWIRIYPFKKIGLLE